MSPASNTPSVLLFDTACFIIENPEEARVTDALALARAFVALKTRNDALEQLVRERLPLDDYRFREFARHLNGL